MTRYLPYPTAAGPQSGDDVVVTPESAGWSHAGLHVLTLEADGRRVIDTGATEMVVLPLAGEVEVEVAASATPDTTEAAYSLDGRVSVFSGPSDFVYIGRDSRVTLRSTRGAQIALPSARCERRLESRYGPADGVPVATRGAGLASRQVRNVATDDSWSHAERLLVCEVLTPPGHWSSYPPHKHDASAPCRVANEEIYYFRIAGRDGLTPGPDGFGLHRTYTGLEHEAAGLAPIDDTVQVRDNDVYCVPYGYHGPCSAAPDYPMYYLNVLAAGGPERSMAFCDDPAHAWVRDTWQTYPAPAEGTVR